MYNEGPIGIAQPCSKPFVKGKNFQSQQGKDSVFIFMNGHVVIIIMITTSFLYFFVFTMIKVPAIITAAIRKSSQSFCFI